MFDNYDIQDASSKAADAIELFDRSKSYSTASEAISRLNELLILNNSRNHLQKYDCLLRITCDLGRMYNERYDMHGIESDLAYGISFYEQAERMMGELHPDYPVILNSLGNLLCERFISERNPLYLEMGIENFKKTEEFYRKMLVFESIDCSKRYNTLNNFARCLREKYAATGSKNNLDEAIDVYKKALQFSPDDAHVRSTILNNLAISLRDRFELYQKIEDLNEAIEFWKKSLHLEKNPKYISSIYSNLSEGLKYRYLYYYEHFEKELAFRDLNNAIFYSQKAVNGGSSNLNNKAIYLGNFGNQLRELYAFLRDSSKEVEANTTLDKAIAVFEEVIKIIPTKSRDRIGSLNNLGNALREKYDLSGEVSFLLRSFYAYKEANKSLNSAFLNASITGVYKILKK